jgi:hypothetical protein
MLLLYAVIIGLALGFATRGRLSRLANVHIRLWQVALLGFVFQAALFSPLVADDVGRLGPSLYVVSTTLVTMALVVNLPQHGFGLITLGACLNLAAIVANGGQMPASPEAVAAFAGTAIDSGTGFANSVRMDAAVLPFLGDIFVLPRPLPFANIFSIGDVLIGVGGAYFIWRTMHSGRDAIAQTPPATRVGRSTRPRVPNV